MTVRKIEHSLGVILPAEATAALQSTEGDKRFLTQRQEGFRITPYDPAGWFSSPKRGIESALATVKRNNGKTLIALPDTMMDGTHCLHALSSVL